MVLYSINKKITNNFTVYVSEKIYNKHDFYYFNTREDAFMCWRYNILYSDVSDIYEDFSILNNTDYLYNIYIYVINKYTNQKIQFLLVEDNYKLIINQVDNTLKKLMKLDEEWEIFIYYGYIKKNNKINTVNKYRKIKTKEYIVCNILQNMN